MTPHNEAKIEDIASTVIMPGDPLRTKYIAEKYLKDFKLVNDVRNMYAYTGYYKGKRVTIMGSGMGIPSMGIYSYELYKFYNVENIIRIGSCGAYKKELELYDLILVNKSYSNSNYAKTQNGCNDEILKPSLELNNKIKEIAQNNNIKLNEGLIYSSEVFYQEKDNYLDLASKYDCLGVEMESFALFHNANVLGKKAACILTVSDNFITKAKATIEERETAFDEMVKLALEAI